jgi:uncharacterized protein YukE
MSPEKTHARRGRDTDELRQLRATVAALRDELDRARIGEDVRMQQAVNTAHEEMQALRRTIQALRDELDASVRRARDERDRLEGDWRGQLVEAQRTIVELRAQLERYS